MEHGSREGAVKIVSLFSGIGGFELGLEGKTVLLCEIDLAAQSVLRARFPNVPLYEDVRALQALPGCDILTAGFPCQDLSQVGRTTGIKGKRSSLVGEVFRLLERSNPTWLLLENVPFMLSLDRGAAIAYLTSRLTELDFAWAYRIVDSRAFGLPQRRRRVILLASRTKDPRTVLFADNGRAPDKDRSMPEGVACGFSWTEGLRGLGWAVDAVPTIKSGSGIGIPSPPAIILPDRTIITPDIRDAERLQGFPENWTATVPERDRWRLVGNAVSVPVARWIGDRLRNPRKYSSAGSYIGDKWPKSAYQWRNDRAQIASGVTEWPEHKPYALTEFLRYPGRPLSLRAARGFRERTRRSSLRFPPGFLDAIDAHIEKQSARPHDIL